MMNNSQEQNPSQFVAIVLAGDRTDADPVALEAGTPCKAIAPVGGRPMVMRVIDALQESSRVSSIILCGPQESALQACPDLSDRIAMENIRWLPSQDSPSKSVETGLSQIESSQPVLVTTADHALLSPEIVTHFIEDSLSKSVDAAFGLVEYRRIKEAFPSVRRTVIKLRGGPYCGCNLFAFMTPNGRKLVPFWRNLEQERKRPWKMVVGILGVKAIISYLLGRLSLKHVLEKLSRRLDLTLDAALLPYPRVGVDVDTPEDRKFVEQILSDPNAP